MSDPSQSPLAGKRIVVTRPLAQCAALCAVLRDRGGEPLEFPLIKIVAAEDFTELDAGLKSLRVGDWIILTSQNAVKPVASRLRSLRAADPNAAREVHIAAVGPATQQAAKDSGLEVHYVAKVHDGVSLAHELGEWMRRRRVLLPRSDIASAELPAAIREYGGEVLEAIAYRTEHSRECAKALNGALAAETVDAIVCFSPSAVHSLVSVVGRERIASIQSRVTFVAIGPSTGAALGRAGIPKPLVASGTIVDEVVHLLTDYFADRAKCMSSTGAATGPKALRR